MNLASGMVARSVQIFVADSLASDDSDSGV
jgi:hypothetical protein